MTSRENRVEPTGLFTTAPDECPYLHDRLSRLELYLATSMGREEYAARLAEGWRRFGDVIYRAKCEGCNECRSLRILVDRFKPSRSQRRVLRTNRDVKVEIGAPVLDDDRIELHRRFHRERRLRRGWPESRIEAEEYLDTFVVNACPTLEFCYRLDGRLIAVAYVGDAANAWNSIYAFWEPELARRSLGTLDVLVEIGAALQHDKKYLYLGYYVSGCPSMEYKRLFRPCEVLSSAGWVRFESETDRTGRRAT